MRTYHQIDRSRLWLQLLGCAAWLSGAGMSAVWMLRGGGALVPLTVFAAWAVGVCFILVRSLDIAQDRTAAITKAVRYGGYSVVVLAVGILFFEYWPVTVSMAFMFAICRTFTDEDSPAHI